MSSLSIERPAGLATEVATTTLDTEARGILERARSAAAASGSQFAGSLPPRDAWALVQAGQARLVDVRSPEELRFVGHVPGALSVAWATGTALTRNPRFVRELENRVTSKKEVLLFLCRSGKRSVDAAVAATKAGFEQVYNVLEGFEGDLDAQGQRGAVGGWRHQGLPWKQD